MRLSLPMVAVATACIMLSGCSSKPPDAEAEKKAAPPVQQEPAPDTYKAKFETTKGDFVVEVTRAWAPLGADRFYQLLKSGFFDGSRFFRVLPTFIVQFGINGDPKTAQLWSKMNM